MVKLRHDFLNSSLADEGVVFDDFIKDNNQSVKRSRLKRAKRLFKQANLE